MADHTPGQVFEINQAARQASAQPPVHAPELGQRAQAKPAIYSSGATPLASAAPRKASRPPDRGADDQRRRVQEPFQYPVESTGAPAASAAPEPRAQTRPSVVPKLAPSGTGLGATPSATGPTASAGDAASSSSAAALAPSQSATHPNGVTADLVAQQVAADLASHPQMQELQRLPQMWNEQGEGMANQQAELERIYRFGIGKGRGKGNGSKGVAAASTPSQSRPRGPSYRVPQGGASDSRPAQSAPSVLPWARNRLGVLRVPVPRWPRLLLALTSPPLDPAPRAGMHTTLLQATRVGRL